MSCPSCQELLQSIMGAGNLSRASRWPPCWDWLIFQKLNSTGDSPLFSVLSFTPFLSASFSLELSPLFSLSIYLFLHYLFFFIALCFGFSVFLFISCFPSTTLNFALSTHDVHIFWVFGLCSSNLFHHTFFVVLTWTGLNLSQNGLENSVCWGSMWDARRDDTVWNTADMQAGLRFGVEQSRADRRLQFSSRTCLQGKLRTLTL